MTHLQDEGSHLFFPSKAITTTRSYCMLSAWSLGCVAPSILVNFKGDICEHVPGGEF